MLIDEIKIGMQVRITHKKNPEKTFLSRVEMVESEKTVLIHAILNNGNPIRFTERDTYKLTFISDGSQMNFEAKYLDDDIIDGFIMLRFLFITYGEKVQRRSSFRFACSLPIKFNIVADNGVQSPLIDGIIRDLSSGGIKLLAPGMIPEGTLLRIDLRLHEEYVMAFGQVRMVRHMPENTKFPYNYGISFEVMSEQDEETIVRYVYNEQRKLIKRPRKVLYKGGKKK